MFTFLISGVFLLGSMLPNGDMHELVKVPALVKHYFEHTQLKGEMRFVDFLVLHYTESEGHGHKEEHKNLPCFNHCPLVTVFTCADNALPMVTVPEKEIAPATYAHPLYFFQTSHRIFQPPRV